MSMAEVQTVSISYGSVLIPFCTRMQLFTYCDSTNNHYYTRVSCKHGNKLSSRDTIHVAHDTGHYKIMGSQFDIMIFSK